ncbi:hypothetical protein F4775DRAFT_39918 [Biscogniauxia sp. FL1348]|nr:hypothetical protein F4775DRAFT_39918 [Biscogniauxia sp. FL1348]
MLATTTNYGLLVLNDSNEISHTTIGASCVYPISGIYTRFQRILLYLVFTVTFFSRFHKWALYAGCAWLASATVPAAIHGIILGSNPSASVDSDVGISFVIVNNSLLAASVLGIFRSKYYWRNESGVLMAWNCLLLTAYFLTLWGWDRWFEGVLVEIDIDYGIPDLDTSQMLQMCNIACQGIPYITIPFRTMTDQLVPLTCDILDYRESARSGTPPLMSGSSNDSILANSTVMITEDLRHGGSSVPESALDDILSTFIIGIILSIGRICDDYPPRVTRNWVFRRLTSVEALPHREYSSVWALRLIGTILYYMWKLLGFMFEPLIVLTILFKTIYTKIAGVELPGFPWMFHIPLDRPLHNPTPIKKRFAKGVALICYFVDFLAYLFIPSYLVYNIYSLEVEVNSYPEQESLVAVGQWAPYIAVGLAIFGAVFLRFRRGEKPGQKFEQDAGALGKGTEEWVRDLGLHEPPVCIRQRRQLFTYYTVAQAMWIDFKMWFKDPVTVSWTNSLEDSIRLDKPGS